MDAQLARYRNTLRGAGFSLCDEIDKETEGLVSRVQLWKDRLGSVCIIWMDGDSWSAYWGKHNAGS